MSSKDDNKEGDKPVREDNAPSVVLRVQKAKKRDIGKSIIRIDQKTMEKLNIKTGDVIQVNGKKQSAGIAWPSYPQDNGLGIVRVDSRLQKNTGTRIDDTLEIRKVKAEAAQNIVLAPSSVKIRNNPRLMIKNPSEKTSNLLPRNFFIIKISNNKRSNPNRLSDITVNDNASGKGLKVVRSVGSKRLER